VGRAQADALEIEAGAKRWQAASSIATSVGLRLAGAELLQQPYDYEGALASVPPDHRSTLIIPIAPAFYRDRERLAEFCVRHRIASMSAVREFADAGGLISYGLGFSRDLSTSCRLR
jgi:putative ABC transport system substrate-binding protein